MTVTTEQPQVTRVGALDMQVYVPGNWTDKQVVKFAEQENPSGTNGWHIRREEDVSGGYLERNPCSKRDKFVHIMLDV